MEKKTNLSEEFGSSSGIGGREFGANYARLDARTDLSSEINRSKLSGSEEFGGADNKKEFSSISTEPAPAKKAPPGEHHRRTLLLQMASLGLSAVLVTNAMGLDVLGDDMLFPSEPDIDRHIAVYEVVEESRHDEDEKLETTPYYIYSSDRSKVDPGPYGDTVRYDEASNTLYLDGCRLDELLVNNMEEDVTIFVESTSYIAMLTSYGTGLTISGNPGTSLIVNDHTREWWWHGIILYGEGRDVSLSISPEVTLDVRGGESAIAVDNTTADIGIRYDESRTQLPGRVEAGAFPFTSGAFVEDGETDWVVMDAFGQMAERAIFAPVGTEIPQWDGIIVDDFTETEEEAEEESALPEFGDDMMTVDVDSDDVIWVLTTGLLARDWRVIASSTIVDGVATEDENPTGSMSFTWEGQFDGMLDREIYGTWINSAVEFLSDGTNVITYKLMCDVPGASVELCKIEGELLTVQITVDGVARSYTLEYVS